MASTTQSRMTAAEFAALPETNLPTELIDGELIVTAAPKYTHQKIVLDIATTLRQIAPDGETVISPADVYLDELNAVQPDVFWVSKADSLCKLGQDDCWHGPPDLVVEVLSPDSSRRDKLDKFRLYEAHGVREYWIVEPVGQYVEVWRLDK